MGGPHRRRNKQQDTSTSSNTNNIISNQNGRNVSCANGKSSSVAEHSTSSGPRARTSRHFRQSSDKANSLLRRFIFTFLLVLMFATIWGVYFWIDFYNPKDDVIEEEPEINAALPASQILSTIVTVIHDLLVFQLQMQAFLQGEKLASVIKEQLQPVQDRVTSLTIQTSQYEKMDHISGGPKHFINSAISELDHVEENVLSKLDEEVLEILNEEAQMALAMAESAVKVNERASFVEDVLESPFLLSEKIYIMPQGELVKEDVLEKVLGQTTLTDVLTTVTELANILRRRDVAFTELEEMKNEYTSRPLVEEDLLHYYDLHDMIQRLELAYDEAALFIEENDEELQLVYPLHLRAMDKVSQLEMELHNYATNKRRAYLQLRNTLGEDIRKLRIRVQNLRYKYVKITSHI